MSARLHRLVYYSRNEVGLGLENAVRSILEASRRNNVAADVTGALMFNAGCFAQVLEGPLDALEAIFERIQQDERHSNVAIVSSGPAENRRFPEWSMAFVGTAADDATLYAPIGEKSGFDLARMSGDEMTEALVRLVQEDERM